MSGTSCFSNKSTCGNFTLWAKKYPGEICVASGFLLMGAAVALIFGVGGTIGIAGIFLILVAGALLCGKAFFPEDGDDSEDEPHSYSI